MKNNCRFSKDGKYCKYFMAIKWEIKVADLTNKMGKLWFMSYIIENKMSVLSKMPTVVWRDMRAYNGPQIQN